MSFMKIDEVDVWIRPDRVFLVRRALELNRPVEDRCVIEFESGRVLDVPVEADVMVHRIEARENPTLEVG